MSADPARAREFADAVAASASGRRVRLADLWEVFAGCDRVGAAALDARARLQRLLLWGAEQGHWQLSAGSEVTADPPLPRFVLLPGGTSGSARRPVGVPLRPELSWASALSLAESQRQMLLAVNRWLAQSAGRSVPLVPSAERSVELFGDEKAIDEQRGGRTLWRPGRLDGRLLRFFRSDPPFVAERVGRARRLLLVENQATFLSAVRVLSEVGGSCRYGVVGWGEGASILRRFASVWRLEVDAVDYFGDVDEHGLQIADKLSSLAAADGSLPAVGPASELYRMLVGVPSSPASGRVAAGRAVSLAGWLGDEQLSAWAAGLLADGRRVAQERVGFVAMSADGRWWRR